jgi:hypothetical protein
LWYPAIILSGRSVSLTVVSRSASAFHPSIPTIFPGLAMTMQELPMIWLSSTAFFRPSPENAAAPLWVERHLMPSPSSSVRTSFAWAVVQLKYGEKNSTTS